MPKDVGPLSKLPRLQETESLWRDAVGRARDGRLSPTPPRRQRLVAGAVAIGVFAASAAFAWQAFGDQDSSRVHRRDTAVEPPAMQATLTLTRPSPDAAVPIPTATLRFGDFEAELKATGTSFVHPFATTMELPGSSIGLTAGVPIEMAGDAETATLRILDAYPPGDGEPPVATYDLPGDAVHLPSRPGTYYLFLRAEWSDGWTSYLWSIPVVAPGALQFVTDDHGRDGKATADLWVDGRKIEGAVVRQFFMDADIGGESPGQAESFGDSDYVPIHAGAPIRVLADDVQELTASLTGPTWADTSEPGERIPLFGPRALVPRAAGPGLLLLDAAWQEGAVGQGQFGYREEVTFAFPVRVVGSVGSPVPLPTGDVRVVFTVEPGKIPQAMATYGGVGYPAVMTAYRFTIDGERFEASHQHVDAATVGAATITVPAEVTVRFENGPDRVLAAWGDDTPAPVDGIGFSVFGTPDHALRLTFRGEWGDSFVEWELYFQVAS